MKAFAKAIAKTKGSAVDCGTFLEAIIEQFGGVRHLAGDFFKEYQIAKAGSMQRQRCLELISRLMIFETSRRAAAPTPLGQMDEEDLDAVISQYVERMTDGRAAPATAAALEDQASAAEAASPAD